MVACQGVQRVDGRLVANVPDCDAPRHGCDYAEANARVLVTPIGAVSFCEASGECAF